MAGIWRCGRLAVPDRPAPPAPEDIRAWRRARNLSAREAGALVGVTLRAWQMYESGERRMRPALWRMLIAREGE